MQPLTKFALLLLMLSGLAWAADQQLLVTKVVEDDNAMPGGQVFRMLAEDGKAVYEVSCARKRENSWPSVDKRLFKGIPAPEDIACGPFTVGQKYSVFFHDADAKHSHVAGRLVTFMVEEANSHRVTRMVVFKVEKVESR